MEQVRNAEYDWISLDNISRIEEDEELVYLEIIHDNRVWDEFLELGYDLGAKSIAEVNKGESYQLAFEK